MKFYHPLDWHSFYTTPGLLFNKMSYFQARRTLPLPTKSLDFAPIVKIMWEHVLNNVPLIVICVKCKHFVLVCSRVTTKKLRNDANPSKFLTTCCILWTSKFHGSKSAVHFLDQLNRVISSLQSNCRRFNKYDKNKALQTHFLPRL